MNDKELLKTIIKMVEHLNDKNVNGCDINLTAPDGGKLKCHFHYDVELPEGYHDN